MALRYFDLFAGADVPDPLDHEALVLMGGPMSANDDLPWIGPERDMIRRAADAGCPVLGVCLGAQVIAKALGGRVYANAEKEIGWFPVHWTEAGAADPLFSGLPNPATVFHWHGETFDLPGGAEWLAYSERCRNQAFRYGDRIYGLQFHLEVTPEMIADWCAQEANCGDLRGLAAPPNPQAHAAEMRDMAATVFGRWLEAY